MRALTGAIIAAGAMIGLGLTALGLGTRYQGLTSTVNGQLIFIRFKELDTPMMAIVVVLLLGMLIGVGTAFLGLAYHHERRFREHQLSSSAKSRIDV